MVKIINLFNHKGGVSKTTTVFNLGWKLAMLGKKVIIADFDPQCNLTGMVLGYTGIDDLESSYKASPPNNVKDMLAPAFESQPRQIVGADCMAVKGNEYLWLPPRFAHSRGRLHANAPAHPPPARSDTPPAHGSDRAGISGRSDQQ